ncbi:MAG: glycosyltransferase, partial [Muribaculaceae bacterium]|nr:glycosyltransferase [Muribaculaceae bacterium]
MSDVLVIIPTYNEIENIKNILEAVMKYPDGFDVLVIDDNSPDGTAEEVERVMKNHPGRVFL